jgi:hypothetical protein
MSRRPGSARKRPDRKAIGLPLFESFLLAVIDAHPYAGVSASLPKKQARWSRVQRLQAAVLALTGDKPNFEGLAPDHRWLVWMAGERWYDQEAEDAHKFGDAGGPPPKVRTLEELATQATEKRTGRSKRDFLNEDVAFESALLEKFPGAGLHKKLNRISRRSQNKSEESLRQLAVLRSIERQLASDLTLEVWRELFGPREAEDCEDLRGKRPAAPDAYTRRIVNTFLAPQYDIPTFRPGSQCGRDLREGTCHDFLHLGGLVITREQGRCRSRMPPSSAPLRPLSAPVGPVLQQMR